MQFQNVLLVLLLTIKSFVINGFLPPILNRIVQFPTFSNKAFYSTRTETTEAAPSLTAKTTLPSWEDLATDLESITKEDEAEIKDTRTPLLTLYRDTNGWCPFCERVWVCLEAKNIPYQERLINLQNKPSWYKDLVPTNLVPAIVFHNDVLSNQTSTSEKDVKSERRIVWESSEIIKALDEMFEDDDAVTALVMDNAEYRKAEESNGVLTTAGFRYTFAASNTSLTTDDISERKSIFEEKLNELDTELLSRDGPFRLGKNFTALDAMMIPSLERWRYQLPISNDVDILNNRKGLQRWFDAMDNYPAFKDRVAGDEYSWTAVASYFLKIFSGNGTSTSEDVKEAMLRADNAATTLESSFEENCNLADKDGNSKKNYKAKILAAEKVLSNHKAIIQDCTNTKPKTQVHIPRATDVQAADLLLRYVAYTLVQSSKNGETLDSIVRNTCSSMLVDAVSEDREEAALAARTVARRLCVPRDMGALSGVFLRGVLSTVATMLEKE